MSHADDLLAHWATIAANRDNAGGTPNELHTTIAEWAKGPYRLDTQECAAVMDMLAELEAFVAGLGDQTGHHTSRPAATKPEPSPTPAGAPPHNPNR